MAEFTLEIEIRTTKSGAVSVNIVPVDEAAFLELGPDEQAINSPEMLERIKSAVFNAVRTATFVGM